ncbi:MAG: glycosyltransferase [Verrucomicrobiales bacterium]|nr:glycosyltransferase [Verrucomicrobiales bacterium]
MARFALMVPTWTGHLNPMSTLGRELQRRGHEVTALSFPDSAPRLAQAGLEHRIVGADVFPPGDWGRRSKALSRLSGIRAARYTVTWIARMTDVMMTELPRILRAEGFQGLVMDQVCYGAECAASDADVPLAMACNALPVHFQTDIPLHTETWPWPLNPFSWIRNRIVQTLLLTTAQPLFRPIRRHQEAAGIRWNVRRHLNEVPPSLVQVAQLPACLDFPRRQAPDHFHHTGPWHEPAAAGRDGFDWNWLDGRPLIYASLGTLQNGLTHLYQIILDACAQLPVQVVLTLGRDTGPRPDRIPANAQVLGYGPQLALLERASLVISHAGMNTTLEALSLGLPLVALPIANEQPGIASRIRHAGAGEFLSIRSLDSEQLRRAVETVSGNPSYRERARACADQIRRDHGLSRAAERVEEALTTRRRIVRRRD